MERAEREKTEAEEAAARQLAEQQAVESAKEANLKSTLQQKQQVLLHLHYFPESVLFIQGCTAARGKGGDGGLAMQGISVSRCDTETHEHPSQHEAAATKVLSILPLVASILF